MFNSITTPFTKLSTNSVIIPSVSELRQVLYIYIVLRTYTHILLHLNNKTTNFEGKRKTLN